MGNFLKGTYTPRNPEKYVGKGEPYFRSSWEKRCFYYFDTNKNILEWASENIAIQYFYPLDNKNHRYYPDIYCKVRKKDGDTATYVIEIKPYAQSVKPKPPKNKSAKAMRNYNNARQVVLKNEFKWKAAEEYCKKKGFTFRVITEKQIFPG